MHSPLLYSLVVSLQIVSKELEISNSLVQPSHSANSLLQPTKAHMIDGGMMMMIAVSQPRTATVNSSRPGAVNTTRAELLLATVQD